MADSDDEFENSEEGDRGQSFEGDATEPTESASPVSPQDPSQRPARVTKTETDGFEDDDEEDGFEDDEGSPTSPDYGDFSPVTGEGSPTTGVTSPTSPVTEGTAARARDDGTASYEDSPTAARDSNESSPAAAAGARDVSPSTASADDSPAALIARATDVAADAAPAPAAAEEEDDEAPAPLGRGPSAPADEPASAPQMASTMLGATAFSRASPPSSPMVGGDETPSASPQSKGPPKKKSAPPPTVTKAPVASPQSPAAKHEDQKAWEQATLDIVDEERQRSNQLKKAVAALEKAEAQRIAAEIAERERQAAAAAAAEERRKRKEQRLAEERLKKEQADDMRRAHQEMMQAKKNEANALKAATAGYHKAIQAENEAQEIAEGMKRMNDAMQKLGNAISKCQHEVRMKFSSMLVCEKRLEMRDEKPESEAFRDKVHAALEEEAKVLQKSREELLTWVNQGQQLRGQIEHTLLLLTTGPSRDNVKRRLEKSPSLPAISQKLAATPSHQDLVQSSHAVVAQALEVTVESLKCLERTQEECAQAAAHVSDCFDQRNAKTVALRKSIESQRKELTATIADTSRRLSLLKMRMGRVGARKDLSEEELQAHEATKTEVAETEALVLELKRGKRRLEEDYRLKTSSFRIDRSCRGLTKVRAGTHTSKLAPLGSPTGTQSSPAL